MVIVAPIVVVMVAMLCLLIYYGADQLGKVIIAWTPDISIPHVANLRDIVRTVVHFGVGIVRDITKPFTDPIVDFMRGTALWVLKIVYGGLAGVYDAAVALHRLATVVIPNRLDALRDWAIRHLVALEVSLGARIHELRDWTTGRLGDLRTWAAAAIAAAVVAVGTRVHELRDDVLGRLASLRDWVTALVAAEIAAVGARIHELRDWTAQRVLGVEADMAAAVRAVEHDIVAGLHTAEDFAAAAAHAAERAAILSIEVTATSATAVVDGLIIDELDDLLGAIATDFPDIRAALGKIDLSKVGELAGVLSITGAISLAMTRYLRECGIPNCRNLGSYGRYLQDLLALVGAGSLFAALAELVQDPEGAARATVDALDDVLDAGVGVVRDLIGA